MSSVVWVAEPSLGRLREHLPTDNHIVDSVDSFVEAMKEPNSVAFIDGATLAEVERVADTISNPIVVICDDPLPTAIGWLRHDWISHVMSASMLEHPIAGEHLRNVTRTLKASEPRLLDWLGPTVVGRRIRLAQSNKRAARIDKMSEYLEAKGVGTRTLQLLRDASEELLTNAFYNAPVAAGVSKPVSRTQEIELPENNACDLAYGCREDLAIVRVRDPFGSLSRKRLVEVLNRCARSDMKVEVDETMGGAGLGMWRIFSGASFVAVSVINHRHTEVLVGIAKKAPAAPRPFAFHFFFTDKKRRASTSKQETKAPSMSKSVVLVSKSK